MYEIRRFNVAVTDESWYRLLASRPDLDEVNFWQPSPTPIRDGRGTPWLFKLRAPKNVIVGGGFFSYYARLPIGVAWDTFDVKNGVDSFETMLERVAKYRKVPPRAVDDVGCVVLGQPFFFTRDDWIPIPADWKPNIVKGKHYALGDETGSALWAEVQRRLVRLPIVASPLVEAAALALGEPLLIRPRLGQGSFRIAVLDAYDRRCAVTGERTLPALEAAHIKPFSIVKAHEIANGLALRSDLHRLYDQGLVSVRPDLTFAVSPQIRERFENGRDYYALEGKALRIPARIELRPDSDALDWHYSERFKA